MHRRASSSASSQRRWPWSSPNTRATSKASCGALKPEPQTESKPRLNLASNHALTPVSCEPSRACVSAAQHVRVPRRYTVVVSLTHHFVSHATCPVILRIAMSCWTSSALQAVQRGRERAVRHHRARARYVCQELRGLLRHQVDRSPPAYPSTHWCRRAHCMRSLAHCMLSEQC